MELNCMREVEVGEDEVKLHDRSGRIGRMRLNCMREVRGWGG